MYRVPSYQVLRDMQTASQTLEVSLLCFSLSRGAQPSPLGLSWSFTRSCLGHTLQAVVFQTPPIVALYNHLVYLPVETWHYNSHKATQLLCFGDVPHQHLGFICLLVKRDVLSMELANRLYGSIWNHKGLGSGSQKDRGVKRE